MNVPSPYDAALVAGVGLALLAAAASHAYWLGPCRRAVRRAVRPLRTPRVALVAAGTLGTALVATGGLMALAYDPVPPLGLHSALDESPLPQVEADPAVRATTDRGRPVAVLRAVAPRDAATLLAVERRRLAGHFLNERLLREGPPDDASNCVGWVFANGRYWIDPEDVPHILADNGYRPVRTPGSGDVVVYRADDGRPVHVGVVQTVRRNGAALVTGKLGWMGAFTHKVDETTYGRNFAYYRSGRRGHALAGLPAATDPPGTPRSPRPPGPPNAARGPRVS